jgi:hypothetical protein
MSDETLEVTLSMEDKELRAKDVMLLLGRHEAECSLRYEAINEKLTDQKAALKTLDMRMWGIAALIVATAIAERFV